MTDLTIDTESTQLTKAETDELQNLETRIESNLRGFLEVGAALAEIRERRLYRVDYDSFDAYLKDRWQFSRSYASRLIGAAETVPLLPQGNSLSPAIGEKHLRPLLQFPAECRGAVWERITKMRGDSPTASDIEREVKSLIAVSNDEPFKSIRQEQKRAYRERRAKDKRNNWCITCGNVTVTKRGLQCTECASLSSPIAPVDDEPQTSAAEADFADRLQSWCKVQSDNVDLQPAEMAAVLETVATTLDDQHVDVQQPLATVIEKHVPKSKGVGVQLAHEAIAALKRIPEADALRSRAFEIVRDWMDRNE